MRMQNDLWQGCGYWQNQFIQQNILLLGYLAWNGYLNAGKGIVVCNLLDPISSSINWEVEPITFHREFIPQTQIKTYLQTLELQLEAIAALLKVIATYDPHHAIVLLVISNGVVDINLLKNLKISPVDCYTQVQHRWGEFQPVPFNSNVSLN